MPDDLLVYAHIGDLHLTEADTENFRDFAAIVSEISAELAGQIAFVFLPGDNADNGRPEQYALAARELTRLPMPVHVITGDHDMEPGRLDAFYDGLGAFRLPKAVDAGGVRCLFLDICGPGTGGPDFRIGADQSRWLASELSSARDRGQRCAVFMHSYPDDLKGDGETGAMNAALAEREVLLVDMGHTHYNEVANDGRTIFSAVRSTGQIEEGPVGFALATIDGRVVSWRFRELGASYPAVLITAPADRRFATDADDPDHLSRDGSGELRVSVLGRRPVMACRYRLGDGPSTPMRRIATSRYGAALDLRGGATTITVEAEDDLGRTGHESIEIAGPADFASKRHGVGSDADTIGAWTERGLLGTQLGPNRNGRKW